jgi:CubicO group peptidase (beta-lactamase class C family)
VRTFVLVSVFAGLLAATTDHLQAQEPSPERVAARAGALMRDLVRQRGFQGAVVLGRNGRVEYAAGFGFADRERRVRFTPDTPTDGGSLAKPFTTAALLSLVGEGRLSMETPVREVLPEYPHPATRIRHLLSHSAGLPGYEWLDTRVPRDEPRTNASHLALVARDSVPPAFPPGSAYTYDNVAYDVAAMVIERIEGAPYAEIMARRFFGPLTLEAFVRPARFANWPGTRTRGYRRTAGGWELHDAYDLEGFHGGGNIYLSARDLFTWMDGYPRVVSDTARWLALAAARLDDGRTTGLTLGNWYASADGSERYYTGHHNGFYGFGYADDARGIVIAWVANDAPPPWVQPALSRALIVIARGGEPEPIRAPRDVPAPSEIAGRYEVPGVGGVVVRQEGRRVYVRVREVEYEAFAVPNRMRYVPGLDAYLRFTSTSRGGVVLRWESVYSEVVSALRE